MAQLKFELDYYDAAVQRFNYYSLESEGQQILSSLQDSSQYSIRP